ncbi:extracellular solute-binding protein [Intestinimonas timonensis]|uniref:extracellular solute-binding protein n=1 Tax=Intestinimonas timonensis TaxID=1689270 RepID=UPI001F5F6A49|nr:extracellular solute-binding protein [Intestinimonas timonensis]
MKKKLLAALLCSSMALSLTACGGQPSASDPGAGDGNTGNSGNTAASDSAPTKMTLILRGGAYGESLQAMLPAFEEEHNVDIEVQLLSFDDLHTGIALDAANPVGTYDLCMVDGSWMAEFTANGVLANLSDMGYSFDDDIIPATTSICTVGEDIYLAPYYGNVTVLMYNKQLIADAGYTPEDIDSFADIMDIAQKTRAADASKNGFLIRGGSADNIVSDFLSHLLVHGGWVVDENNQPTVNTPEFKAAMEEYLALYNVGSTLDKDDIVASVSSGETALAQIWPGWYVPTADGPANYTTIPTKLTDDSDAEDAVALQGVWCIGIPENAPNKELALELLKYVMDPQVQLASIDKGGVPCRYSSLMDETVLQTYPHLETVCGALETGVYRPAIEEWTQFTNILGQEMDNIIQGIKSLDDGLADAQSALEDLMG